MKNVFQPWKGKGTASWVNGEVSPEIKRLRPRHRVPRGVRGGLGTVSFVLVVAQAELHVSLPASWCCIRGYRNLTFALRCEAATRARWRPRSIMATGCENTQRGCARQLSASSNVQWAGMAQLGRGLMSWRMGLTGLWMVLRMHSSYRLGVSELQDDKLSVPKPQIPCKTHCFLALCMLQSGQTPPFTQQL